MLNKIIFSKFIKSIIKIVNGLPFITSIFGNVSSVGNNVSDVTQCTEYGSGSYPMGYYNSYLVTIEDSRRSVVSLGFSQSIPQSPYTPNEGESWRFSQKYIMYMQNNGIMAYRITDPTNTVPNNYSATLISGEWVNKIVKDLIEDNNVTLRTFINQTLQTFINDSFTNHIHYYTTPATVTGKIVVPVSYTPIQPNTDLASDLLAVTPDPSTKAIKTLIADGGTNPNG